MNRLKTSRVFPRKQKYVKTFNDITIMPEFVQYWQHLRHVRMFMGWVEHTVKVTHLGNGIYGCRCFVNGELNCEYRCKGKRNIGDACRCMLRWESKIGNYSDFADSARKRGYRESIPIKN
jgi:hypothetical protein